VDAYGRRLRRPWSDGDAAKPGTVEGLISESRPPQRLGS
jgi:hypothetical protein